MEVDSFLSGGAGRDGFIEPPAIEISLAAEADARQARVVELRFFGGLSEKETDLTFYNRD
jgi:hypothetical protein